MSFSALDTITNMNSSCEGELQARTVPFELEVETIQLGLPHVDAEIEGEAESVSDSEVGSGFDTDSDSDVSSSSGALSLSLCDNVSVSHFGSEDSDSEGGESVGLLFDNDVTNVNCNDVEIYSQDTYDLELAVSEDKQRQNYNQNNTVDDDNVVAADANGNGRKASHSTSSSSKGKHQGSLFKRYPWLIVATVIFAVGILASALIAVFCSCCGVCKSLNANGNGKKEDSDNKDKDSIRLKDQQLDNVNMDKANKNEISPRDKTAANEGVDSSDFDEVPTRSTTTTTRTTAAHISETETDAQLATAETKNDIAITKSVDDVINKEKSKAVNENDEQKPPKNQSLKNQEKENQQKLKLKPTLSQSKTLTGSREKPLKNETSKLNKNLTRSKDPNTQPSLLNKLNSKGNISNISKRKVTLTTLSQERQKHTVNSSETESNKSTNNSKNGAIEIPKEKQRQQNNLVTDNIKDKQKRPNLIDSGDSITQAKSNTSHININDGTNKTQQQLESSKPLLLLQQQQDGQQETQKQQQIITTSQSRKNSSKVQVHKHKTESGEVVHYLQDSEDADSEGSDSEDTDEDESEDQEKVIVKDLQQKISNLNRDIIKLENQYIKDGIEVFKLKDYEQELRKQLSFTRQFEILFRAIEGVIQEAMIFMCQSSYENNYINRQHVLDRITAEKERTPIDNFWYRNQLEIIASAWGKCVGEKWNHIWRELPTWASNTNGEGKQLADEISKKM